MRKLHALKINMVEGQDPLPLLKKRITEHMCEKQHEAIASWKAVSRVWKGSDAVIYRFLRNEPPAKPGMIMTSCGPSSEPSVISSTLNCFWGRIEDWVNPDGRETALDRLEDFYAAHLPT